AKGVPDVEILELPPQSDLEINALQRMSTVVLQKSLREGFALTVSEALWKRRAVVASAVGGIPLQVLDERTGLLVRSIEGTAFQTVRLLDNPELRRDLGAEGRIHVRDNFLHTREVRDYLAVFARVVGKGRVSTLARAGRVFFGAARMPYALRRRFSAGDRVSHSGSS